MQAGGGCLVFCTTKKQCEVQAVAFSQQVGVDSIDPATHEARQQIAFDLACSQAGQIQEPLQELLLGCSGAAYHHAGACRTEPDARVESVHQMYGSEVLMTTNR